MRMASYVATPPPIQERNAVGAGDALAVGLVWALDQGLGPVDIARWGVATGTASAAVDGVASGTIQEIETILTDVQISTCLTGSSSRS